MQRQETDSARARRRWVLPLTLVALGAVGWACQDLGDGSGADAGPDPLGGDVSRRDVLDSIGRQVVAPHTASFVDAAQVLSAASADWAGAIADASPDADAAHDAARNAWREAMLSWQRLEVMQVGPAASSLSAVGGEDRRDAIYSWPTADACSVDRALAESTFKNGDFFESELVWAYGLDALERLLFAPDFAHACPDQVQLDSTWDALGEAEITHRRAAYAAVVASGVVRQAEDLAARWATDEDDFTQLLAGAGEGDSPYENAAEALDAVFAAMFYLDKQTKDGKLGVPLGLVEGCAAAPCLDDMEAPLSGVGAPAVAANLHALRELVQGGPDPDAADGFDDLLIGVGEEDLAAQLLAEIDAAIAIAEGIEAPLTEVVASDPEAATSLHAAVKRVTDLLKGPVVMALMLTVPAEGAGDND